MAHRRRDGSFPRPFGRYTLVHRVAMGGMAEVDLAIEEITPENRRFVIVKRIREDQALDPDYVDFFLTEGRVALRCTHPNLPQIFELGRVGRAHYIAMEYIHGHTLLDMVRAAILSGENVSLPVAVGVGLGVAAALEHLHALRDVNGTPLHVIHRDVTPQNIMVSTAGTVKLIDFGIVRSSIQVHRTAAGIVKGKFAYMAPEQLEGRRSLDHRADLFALGIVLWECLAARSLFRAHGELETAERVHHMRIPAIREVRGDVPRTFSAVIARALERDPERRFQSATDFLAALEHVAEHCHVLPTVTRLRQEVIGLCGAPKLPAVPTRIAPARTGVSPADVPDEVARPAALPPRGEHPHRSNADAAAKPAASSGLARDPLLLYFLRQAGARSQERCSQAAEEQSDTDA